MVMYVEHVFVLSIVYPAIMPLSLIALYLHLCVFHASAHYLKVPTVNHIRPSMRYLYLSFILGCSLVMWFYGTDDSVDSTVSLIVLIGTVIVAIAGLGLGTACHMHTLTGFSLEYVISMGYETTTGLNMRNWIKAAVQSTKPAIEDIEQEEPAVEEACHSVACTGPEVAAVI